MGDTEKCNTEMMQRLHSSFGSTTSSSSIPKSLNPNQHQLELNPNFINRSSQFPRFSVLPPTSPYSQIPTTRPGFNPGPGPTHSRSMSQPSSFFSFDSLPPLSPSPFRNNDSAQQSDVSMEDNRDFNKNNNNSSSVLPPSSSSPFTRCNSTSSTSSLPPRKSHRRSNSDNIPTMFNNPIPVPKTLERSISGGGDSSSSSVVKKESSSSVVGEDKEAMDDLFSAYMNLENIDVLNSSEADDSKNGNNRDDMESSRASGTKTNNGSDTEGESSSVNESGNNGNNNNNKRRASGEDIAPTSRHYRSVSVDSCFMEKFSSFGDEISSLKPPPSPGSLSRKVSPTNSVDGNSGFSIEFKNGEFTAAEMKKIMGNDKLAEMAMSDPKRVKRILANRQSAARSKERKMRYIVELEHKVQTLQTEATTLSAQLTLLQRDMMGLTNQNNELKFRLQAMEQQARLRDALNEALNGEVQRLKLAIGEANHNESDRSKMQSLNAEMFQQLNISQLRPQPQPQSQQNQNGTMATKPESNE